MRSRFALAAFAAALLGAGAPAFADSQDVDVDGNVIAALVTTVDQTLTLPDVAMPVTGTTTVTLSQAGSTSYGTGGSPGTQNTSTAAVAKLTSAGESGYTFAITAPTASLGTGLSFAPSCPATGTVGAQFDCGGTLTVSTTATPGALTAAKFTVTVAYN